jgi:hypothetical protein
MILHTTATEHFLKLRRVPARLEKDDVNDANLAEFNDGVDDFCKTAYRLIENIAKDVSPQTRRRRSRIVRSKGDHPERPGTECGRSGDFLA